MKIHARKEVKEMKGNVLLVLSISILLLFSWVMLLAEECPKTGTSFDALIKEAYDCKKDFDKADVSVDHGVETFKDIYCSTLGMAGESKDSVMAMADSSFLVLVADDSVKAMVKEKLADDGKAMLDTLKSDMDVALSDLKVANDAALELSKNIPAAIKKLPNELKGLNAMKIPKVKAALEKAKGWVDDVKAQIPDDVDITNTVLGIVGYLLAENVGE
jgi:hypothetical protein